MSFEDLSKQFGFSRATYYRKRKILEGLNEGKTLVRKLQRPKLRKWSAAETALVLKIRRENPTYGKFKINFISETETKMSVQSLCEIRAFQKIRRYGYWRACSN
jgi:hypothetical protein